MLEFVSLCNSDSLIICKAPSLRPKAFLMINKTLPGVIVILVFFSIFKKVCLS